MESIREQVAELLTTNIGGQGIIKDECYEAYLGLRDSAVNAVLNLFKAEVGKLTVMTNGEIQGEINRHLKRHPDHQGYPLRGVVAKAQLQDIQKQLLDLMGE